MNYDPNLTNSGRMANQTIKLTFGQWDYRAEMTVVVGGNCTGLSTIRTAVSSALDKLPFRKWKGDVIYHILMADPSDPGKQLECEDDELRGDEWLEDMLIKAEIISIEPDIENGAEAPAHPQHNR